MSKRLRGLLKRWSLSFGLILITFGLASQSEVSFYNSGVEDGWTREFSAERAYSVKTVPAPSRSGATALRMEARYGAKDTDGSYHAEIEKWEAGSPGETLWYGFSTYVPTSWVDSEQTTDHHTVVES